MANEYWRLMENVSNLQFPEPQEYLSQAKVDSDGEVLSGRKHHLYKIHFILQVCSAVGQMIEAYTLSLNRTAYRHTETLSSSIKIVACYSRQDFGI